MSVTPESIIKLVNALAKTATDMEKKQLQQYLIRKNIGWLPLRRIAELTGKVNSMTVQYNIKQVEKSKFLSEFAEDLNLIINA